MVATLLTACGAEAPEPTASEAASIAARETATPSPEIDVERLVKDAYVEGYRDGCADGGGVLRPSADSIRTPEECEAPTPKPTPTATAAPTPVPTPSPAATPAPAPETSFGGGVKIVGSDIQPGTYQSSDSSFCYWERLSGLSGEFDDIIVNDITTEGAAIVSIAPTDVAFSSDGCGTWTLMP